MLFAGWTGVLASTSATFIEALVVLTVFRVPCPKISTGLEKLAPTGWHGWHVFATLQGTPLPPVKTTYLGMLDNLPL